MLRRPRTPRDRATAALFVAERKYDQASYAAALAIVEEMPSDDAEAMLMRAAITHALAELRGDAGMLRQAIEGYSAAAPGLHPKLQRLMPELIEDCHAQLREVGAE